MPTNRGKARDYGNPYLAAGAEHAYHDVRPSYPEQAILWALEGVTARAAVADIGAGTGKLTAQLAELGYRVWAVEPAAQMRAEFERALPRFSPRRLVAASGEATGLAPGAYAAVTYGQSWHWLDPAAASAEAARILQPKGVLAVFVNQLAVEEPWVHRLSRIMRSGDVAKLSQAPELGPTFGQAEAFECSWSAAVTPEEIVDLGTTRASWIRASEAQRAKMRQNLTWYLYEHLGFEPGRHIELPYHTYVWRAHSISSE